MFHFYFFFFEEFFVFMYYFCRIFTFSSDVTEKCYNIIRTVADTVIIIFFDVNNQISTYVPNYFVKIYFDYQSIYVRTYISNLIK